MKRMKKFTALLLAGIVGAGTMAMNGMAVYAEPSDDEIIQAANELFDEELEYMDKDLETFSSLFAETPDEMIETEFSTGKESGIDLSRYDKKFSTVLMKEEPYYLVNVVYYIVSGTHPNTHMESKAFNIGVSNIDGNWKLNWGDTMQAKTSALTNLASENCYNAQSNGRNAVLFGSGNYMYTSDAGVYEGCSNTTIAYAYQNEDGSVSVGIWLANGTGVNIYYYTGTLSITDDTLGTIFSVDNCSIDTSVRAGASTVIEVNIPAEQIQTGTQAWGSLSSQCNITYI